MEVVDDELPVPDSPEVQRPTVELVERPLQPDIQLRRPNADTNRLVVGIEEDSVDFQALTSLTVGLYVEEVEVEGGHPHQHQERDPEP